MRGWYPRKGPRTHPVREDESMSPFNSLLGRCIAPIAAALFIGVSASQNMLHGYEVGAARSQLGAWIFAAGSLAGALMQPVAFLSALQAFRNWQFAKGLIALALGLACFSYATISSLGFTATSRGDMAAQRAAAADAYRIEKLKVDAATSELATLAAAPLASRKLELKRAERRTELEQAIAASQKALQSEPGPMAADPQAEALAAYGAALGLRITAAAIQPWLSLLAVVFFELGAAASLIVVVAANAQPSASASNASVTETLTTTRPALGETSAPVALSESKRRGRRRGVALGDVVTRIEANGGTLDGSLSGIAKLIGAPSRAAAHRALNALACAGLVKIAATAAGTSVTLA